MYRIFVFIALFYNVECANYQPRYESSTYASYQSPSTIANLYNNPYNTARYGEVTNFPEATRYPNSPGFSANQYPYTTPRSGYAGVYNIQAPGSYGSPNFGSAYGSQGYGSTHGSQGYSSNYGSQGYGSSYDRGISSYEQPFMSDIRDYCVNRSPQSGIWVESLMGMWYGVEYIQHLAGDSRVDYAQTCIVIHIAEPMERPSTENQLFHVQHINAKFRQEYRHLRLLWNEAGDTTEYALYFRNDSAGYWQVFAGQNGTIPSLSSYKQFSGTIQVLKAVNDHLVLSFCQEALNGRPAQLYSVLFSREPALMARWEVESVHTLLQNKKLSVASRRMVCGNNSGTSFMSTSKTNSFVLSILLVAVSYAVAS